jgi:hypothetical protein
VIKGSSRGDLLRAALYVLILLWINTYIARDLFFGESSHMGSMHGFWTAIAARAGGSWFSATWWPFWEMGIPFEYTYPPLVPGLAAAIAALRGVSPGMGYQSVTGLCYILGPLTLFVAGWRLMRAPGISFVAALVYSLTSITQLVLPDSSFALKNIWDNRRLFVMTVWDDTPHVAALMLLPLVILVLARSIETRRRVYYAAAALCIAGAALASAFGPVMVALAAVCLLATLRIESLGSNALMVAGIGFWGWAIAAPFLSPSLMAAIRDANAASEGEGWRLGSWSALAFTVLGWSLLHHYLPRWTTDWRMRFLAAFAWIATSIPLAQLWLGEHILPQPGRYKFEMELILCLLLVFAVAPWWERMPRGIRYAGLFFLATLAATQVKDYRQAEKKFTFPRDLKGTIEYRVATWAQQNYPKLRFFMPGSVAQWTNTFTDIQQFTGESFTMAVNQVQQRADTAIAFGTANLDDERRITLAWLKAYGVGLIAVSGKESEEYWKGFTHPEKFEGVLPALWSGGGVTVYRVPLREFTLAHLVPQSAIVRHVPREPDDTTEVERFAAALDDPSLPGTSFDWEGRNRIRIRTTAMPGKAVTIQETYHPGWHASVGAKAVPLFKDGLGMMWLRPPGEGSCEIVLNYDGGWELRVCRWLSWMGLAAALVVLLRRR